MAKNSKEVQARADAKRAGMRTRNWLAICYHEDLPENWTILLDQFQFKWVQSPIHDRDFNADGTPKKHHYHLLFIFDAVKHVGQVSDMLKSIFGESDSGSIIGVATPQAANDRGASVRYMAHMDNPDKAQYDPAEIVGHNGADIAELLRYSATETRLMIIAMEEYIEDRGIVELAEFSKAIRYDYPEWHTILATKMTQYFNAFIRSRRHMLGAQPVQRIQLVKVNSETGEILEEGEQA